MDKSHIKILNKWYKEHTYAEYLMINTNKPVPVLFSHFIYWFLYFHPPLLKNVTLWISDQMLSLKWIDSETIGLSLYNRAKREWPFIVPSVIRFKPNSSLEEVAQRLDNLSIKVYDQQISDIHNTINIDQINEFFVDKIENSDRETSIHNIASTAYMLEVISSDYGKNTLRMNDSLHFKIVLQSANLMSEEEKTTYYTNREKYEQHFRRLFNEYHRFDGLIGRVGKVLSDFHFQMNDFLILTLEVRINFYSEEYYYGDSGYGYLELAINNICQKRLGSSKSELIKLAQELGVNITGLKRNEICGMLLKRFDHLTDDDFDNK